MGRRTLIPALAGHVSSSSCTCGLGQSVQSCRPAALRRSQSQKAVLGTCKKIVRGSEREGKRGQEGERAREQEQESKR